MVGAILAVMNEEVEARLLAQSFLEWLSDRTGAAVYAHTDSQPFLAELGGTPLALSVASVSSAESEPRWRQQVGALAALIGESVAPGVLVWLPAGFDLPDDEPGRAEIVHAVQSTLTALAPGGRGEASLSVTLRIQKRDTQGAYVSASGGLSQHWAKFTDRVQGYFQIDSAALHRPPDDPDRLEALVASLVQASKELQLGEIAAVPAFDLVSVQRLRGGRGCAVIGTPPEDQSEQGAPLRKRLRRVLRDSGVALQATGAPLRAVLLVGHFPSAEDEPVGSAMRGQDPSLFAGIDLVALATDGVIKPLLEVTRRAELGQRAEQIENS